MSDYGEPLRTGNDRPGFTTVYTRDGATVANCPLPRDAERAKELFNLFAGIENPEAWVREVREVIDFFLDEENQIIHDVGYLAEKWNYQEWFNRARTLLAQMKEKP